MSPLRWIQSTGPHWTVMLEEVTLETLTEIGAANRAEELKSTSLLYPPAFGVVAVILWVSVVLDAVTVIVYKVFSSNPIISIVEQSLIVVLFMY